MIPDRVVTYAAQECGWQYSGEHSVAWMIDGWKYVRRRCNHVPTIGDLLKMSAIVEPRKNTGFEFRRYDVRVGSSVKLPWQQVDAELKRLVEQLPDFRAMNAEERSDIASQFFRQYEEIHPLGDGNGRTGSLLYNWINGSLFAPIHPPNCWHEDRRSYEGYPVPKL